MIFLHIDQDCKGDAMAIREYDKVMRYLSVTWPLYIHHIVPSILGWRDIDNNIYYPLYNQHRIKLLSFDYRI